MLTWSNGVVNGPIMQDISKNKLNNKRNRSKGKKKIEHTLKPIVDIKGKQTWNHLGNVRFMKNYFISGKFN